MTAPKVTFYTHTLATGGGTKIIATLANRLVREGHPVDVLAVNRTSEPRLDWFDRGVQVTEVRSRNRLGRVRELRSHFRSTRGIVFSTCEFSSVLTPFLRLGMSRSPALVIVVHTTLSQLLAAERDKHALQWGMRLARRAYARADVVAAVSRAAAEDLQRRLRLRQVRVLRNPVVDTEALESYAPPAPPGWEELPRPIVLGAGRLHDQKDFETLIEAYLQLDTSGCLVVLGEGERRARLEGLVRRHGAEARVRIPGAVDSLLPYMYHSDLFVLSSRYEGSPTVLVEAMSVGCPVVATDCPSGPREILEDGAFGTLVPVGDTAALCRAMRERLQAPREPERLRQRAGVYSIDNSLKEYLSLIHSLAARP